MVVIIYLFFSFKFDKPALNISFIFIHSKRVTISLSTITTAKDNFHGYSQPQSTTQGYKKVSATFSPILSPANVSQTPTGS
jgi:hypothetical protein